MVDKYNNNEKYKYIDYEVKDWELYKKWQSRYFGVAEQNIISYPTDYGTSHDVRFVDIETGIERAIELKGRKPNDVNYDDCYIEMKKYSYLMDL